MNNKDVEAGFVQIATPDKLKEIDGGAPPKPSPSIPMLLLISMPRMAVRMAWAAQWAALGPYLGTMLPKWAVQLTQFIGPLTGIIVGPMIGVLSDRSTHPWGRRRPFLFYAAIASAICWTLMGFTREMGEALGDYGSGKPGDPTSRTWTCLLTVFFYIWMDITVNVVQPAAHLLIADLAGDRQTTGAAMAQGWAMVGAMGVAGYIQIWGAAYLTLHYFLGMLSVTMLLAVGAVCIFVKEEPLQRTAAHDEPALKRIGDAFYSIYLGLRSLTATLMVFSVIIFCVLYGYTAYNGNKGQFFGIVVYDGSPMGADKCGSNCTEAQTAYSHGVRVAGGSTDMMFNSVGYVFTWLLPYLVSKFGAKRVLTAALLPQSCLMVMAFTKVVELDVFFVVITSVSVTVANALIVPLVIHVYGADAEIGIYIGALNSANCFGQILNFAIGAALVETTLGYKLPVFLGGLMSFLGFLISLIFFKVKMNSM